MQHMDTPESKTTPANNTKFKLINYSSSNSSAVQDSPVFNFLSNLSPIQQAKPGPGSQGFPGLASPPLVFTSPRNSQASFFNRKLLSCGSNSEISQDHDNCQKNKRDLGDSLKVDSELHSSLVPSDQKACNNEKLVQAAHCNPSVCLDEFLADPGKCTNSSNKIESEDAHPYVVGGCPEKIAVGNVKDVGLNGSVSQKGKQTAQGKSTISIKVVKNKPHSPVSSSECSGALPRLLSDYNSDICHTGESFNEAGHFERGTLRRCLFYESQQKYSSDGSGFENSIASSQILESAKLSTGKSGSRLITGLSKPAVGRCTSQTTMNSSTVNSKPLGIGLHLNSVVYPRSADSTIGSQHSSVVRVEGNNSLFIRTNHSDKKVSATDVITKAPVSSDETGQHQACTVPAADNTIASDAIVQVNNAVETKIDARSTIKCEKRKLSSELVENNESNLISAKKKRKKSSNSTDDDTTKRCNCRKTKCLKLYCDCFAAGFYCGDSCACQGCFNQPEYEDTVLETRQQIESRNPLAFAPKVMQPVTADSPASIKKIGNLSTPSSARHKRGCNCKKSMCLKKYCECYQANVGCSEGCRCEGCKNIYGIREDSNIAREILIKSTSVEMSERTMTVNNNSFARSRAHNSPNLTPVTPALQCSDQKKNPPKSRLPFRRFLQSSDDTLTSEEDLSSLKKSQYHSLLSEESKCMDVGILDDADKGLENKEDSLVLEGDEFINVACPQSLDQDTSSGILKNISHPKSCDESGPPPPSSMLRWRSSPITPITQLASSELFGTVSKHSDTCEDDTPEILKPSSTPVNSVKVSSPNKKRISPPHNNMNPSESLKSSRKFLLRALPTFPSLTPYSNNGSQQQ